MSSPFSVYTLVARKLDQSLNFFGLIPIEKNPPKNMSLMSAIEPPALCPRNADPESTSRRVDVRRDPPSDSDPWRWYLAKGHWSLVHGIGQVVVPNFGTTIQHTIRMPPR